MALLAMALAESRSSASIGGSSVAGVCLHFDLLRTSVRPNKRNLFFYAFLCFWFATINHSGMRIAAPSFIYALCLLNITYDKPAVHRKLPQ
jgi:hypothetical protein